MIAARLPKIRFRKMAVNSVISENIKAPTESKPQASANVSIKKSNLVLEDYQLPSRFRRQMMDEKEINAINSGGCL